jgi:hypothetical protein
MAASLATKLPCCGSAFIQGPAQNDPNEDRASAKDLLGQLQLFERDGQLLEPERWDVCGYELQLRTTS